MSEGLERSDKITASKLGTSILFSVVFVVLVVLDQIFKQLIVNNVKELSLFLRISRGGSTSCHAYR